MNAIDTNVLVYSVDTHEPIKQAKARELLIRLSSAGETILPWQVVGEYLSCLRRFAACIEAGVKTLYTEDLAANMSYESVVTINPFS